LVRIWIILQQPNNILMKDVTIVKPGAKRKKDPSRLENIFLNKTRLLNIYCTAGFPAIDSTITVMRALQEGGADIIELGMPYSDPLADGPVIQQSNMQALENGMTMKLLFEQLQSVKNDISIPVILMGYLNPVLQYGMQAFCRDAAAAGVDGIILPDLPLNEYNSYRKLFKNSGLHFIFMVTPETSQARIRKADHLSSGFLYAVSSSSTTGNERTPGNLEGYFKNLQKMKLRNPVLVGFGIRDKVTYDRVCKYTSGAVIGSAYINAIAHSTDIKHDTEKFIKSIHG